MRGYEISLSYEQAHYIFLLHHHLLMRIRLLKQTLNSILTRDVLNRLGPKGAKTLCNACGIRWKRNRQRIRPKKTTGPGKKKAKGKAASAAYREDSEEGEGQTGIPWGLIFPPSDPLSHRSLMATCDYWRSFLSLNSLESDDDIDEEELIIPARQRAATAAAQAAIAMQAKQEASPSVSPSRSPSPRGSVGEKFVIGSNSSRPLLGRTEEPKKVDALHLRLYLCAYPVFTYTLSAWDATSSQRKETSRYYASRYFRSFSLLLQP